jgi:hypothetical protein
LELPAEYDEINDLGSQYLQWIRRHRLLKNDYISDYITDLLECGKIEIENEA